MRNRNPGRIMARKNKLFSKSEINLAERKKHGTNANQMINP